jgi:thiamine phosphate phosphatase / amino-HMP aminohydrolase
MDSEGKGTGRITKDVESGICMGRDKLREMKKVTENNPTSDRVVTVYIGDSNTDLPCLLHADIGIVMGDSASLIETCKRVGIKLNHGSLTREMEKRRDDLKDIALHQFRDWHAIIESGLFD